jgi:uncharacterized protein
MAGGSRRQRIEVELRAAMAARDDLAVEALRIALGLVANAEAVPVGEVAPDAIEVSRRVLSDDDIGRVLDAEADDLGAVATTLADAGKGHEAAEVRALAVRLRHAGR